MIELFYKEKTFYFFCLFSISFSFLYFIFIKYIVLIGKKGYNGTKVKEGVGYRITNPKKNKYNK